MDFAEIVNFLDFGFAGLIALYLVTKTTTAINNLTMTIQHQTSILVFIAGKIRGQKRKKDYSQNEQIYTTAS